MRFTEHELTRAVAGAAKTVVAAGDKDVRKGRADIDEVWEQMGRFQRYQVLESVGSQVLPVLIALPDVDVEPGTRPTFTTEQIGTAVEEQLDESSRMRRRVVLAARTALVRAALEALPVRDDPDALLG